LDQKENFVVVWLRRSSSLGELVMPPAIPRIEASVDLPQTVEAKLLSNFTEWMDGIAVISDANQIESHPAYKRIVSMGEAVVPVILRSLEREPSLLAWALFDITGVNPVRPADYGKIDKITKAWLKWGRKNKHVK
jgi:hypothetical protein